MPPNKPFQTVHSRLAWSCPWYAVRQDEIILPNGEPGVYNTITKSDAVWIVPVTAAGEIVLLYQYRYTVDQWCWEVPAGSVKAGDSLAETAVLELREEVGGTAKSLRYISQFYPANGICDEVGHIFLATGVTLGPTAHETAEVMTVHTRSVTTVLQMARSGQISDGPSALALLLCEPYLSPIFNHG
jgi:ADP-ribose pyrophosphatase